MIGLVVGGENAKGDVLDQGPLALRDDLVQVA